MAWKLTNNKESVMAEINITPLTDVMLVLLVIFMVTTPLLMMNSMKLKLPKAATSTGESGDGIILTISEAGLYYINGELVSFDNLPGELSGLLKSGEDSTVVLKADTETRHGIVVELLDIAREAGAKKLSIATEPGKGR